MPFTFDQVVTILAPEEASEGRLQELDASALPHLERLLDSSERSLAVKAAFALGRIRVPRSAELVDRLTRHSDPVMRVAAASSARSLAPGDREATLARLLDDPDLGVRKSALRAVPDQVSASFKARLESVASTMDHPELRDLATVVSRRVQVR